MTYATIDEPLKRWVADHRLQLSTAYRDEEVRSIEIVSPEGRRFQMWLDLPRAGCVGVHLWDYKKRRVDLEVPHNEVVKALDSLFTTAKEWMHG